ncbi:Protein of unknown function [Oceanobacillus limi]|uniref:DUF2929 domain-containing protein n=1 Tax=Oceanobacillus limi TaxID=930131 RepID=A0A1I0C7P7_9BACI|nr:DUF2929 family protein [Oceanobacillus limi]SET14962.1 Protein of unknown function [Oceanobacillus limi]
MRYLMTIVWAILIGSVLSYVLTSMAGDSFAITDTLVLSAIVAIAIFVLGDGVIKAKSE